MPALEEETGPLVQLPRALYFYAGFATNASIIPALVGAGDAIFSDALNHASLIDGCRLSRGQIHRFEHGDLAALEKLLAACPVQRKLVVSDAVLQHGWQCGRYRGAAALCERYDALLLLDDAHGFGVLGPQGRGSLAAAGLTGAKASPRVLYMAPLSKAAGVSGAFVAGHELLIEWLLQKTRSYTFATAAPAMLARALQTSLQLIEEQSALREQLQARIAQLRAGLQPLLQGQGLAAFAIDTAVQALVVGGNDAALGLMEGLRPPWPVGARDSPSHRARGHGSAAYRLVGAAYRGRCEAIAGGAAGACRLRPGRFALARRSLSVA